MQLLGSGIGVYRVYLREARRQMLVCCTWDEAMRLADNHKVTVFTCKGVTTDEDAFLCLARAWFHKQEQRAMVGRVLPYPGHILG